MKVKELTKKSYNELLEKKRNQNKPYSLKSVHKNVNFASKKFSTIWSNWWGGETPPNMEVDLVLIFEDIKRAHDEALIVGVEAEYIKTLKKNFFVGIDQIIAFSLFGFDGLCFWHFFSEEIPSDWYNEEYEALYAEALATLDDAKRQEILFRAQEIAYEECPWIWLWRQYDFYGVSKRLQWTARADERIDFRDATLK